MDIAIAPASGTSSAPAAAGQPVPARVLTPGQIVEAKVLQILADGRARLALAETVIDVASEAKLVPGATVRLSVQASPTGLKLVILNQLPPSAAQPAPPASPVPQPPPATTPAAAVTVAPADPAAIRTAAVPAAGVPAQPAVSAPAAAAALGAQAQPHPPPPQQPTPAVAAAAALSTAVQASAVRQTGLAPLFADAAVAATLASLPEPVRQAARQLLALRPALDETMSADTVKRAFQRSGLFLEARLAAAAGGTPPAHLPAADLKAALAVMRQVLGGWLEQAGAPPQAASAAPAPAVHGEAQPTAATAPQAAAPPPPYRGAPPSAQPVAAPSIPPDAAPEAVGRALIAEVDGALSRQTLLQAASLPDPGDGGLRHDAPRWNFEVPFALPQGTAIAQFEIARDGHGDAETGAPPMWRVRFSVDVEPIGPVHAQVALMGARAAVTLWAERPETSMQLRDNAGRLADALRAADFEGGDVLVRFGAPPRPREPAPSGHFLDRAS